MVLTELVQHIESILPPDTAMEGDRLGVQVQSGQNSIHRVLCTLDLTEEVIEEAETIGANCVLCFHPLIFRPLRVIDNGDRIGRCVQRLIRSGICLISAHTNFDAHPQGTNFALATALGWSIDTTLVPDASRPGYGIGVLCSLPDLAFETVLARVSEVCNSSLRYSKCPTEVVSKVAIVAGSGYDFLPQALASGAHVFVTADLKYHNFFETEGRLALVDPGHYEMEQFVPGAMASLLQESLGRHPDAPQFAVSSVLTNPALRWNR